MQTFGKFATEYDLEYLVEHYLYFNAPGEEITADDLAHLLKKKNKTAAGTIFLYNPAMAPAGYNTDTPLSKQGYEFDGSYTALQFNKLMDIFQSRIRGYEGRLIEVKYLFNYNRPDIEPTSVLETFNEDIEKLPSFQQTHCRSSESTIRSSPQRQVRFFRLGQPLRPPPPQHSRLRQIHLRTEREDRQGDRLYLRPRPAAADERGSGAGGLPGGRTAAR